MDLLRAERLPEIGREASPAGLISAAVLLLFSVAIIAALYLGKVVFVPLAIAFLLAFVLTPVITWLRRYCRMPRPIAILLSVSLLFATVLGIGGMMAQQITGLIEELPRYEWTLMEKMKELRGVTGGSKAVTEASKTLKSLGKELEKPAADKTGNRAQPPGVSTSTTSEDPKQTPVPVVVQKEPHVLETIQSVVGILIEPLATTGIVFVFLSFILFQREDVRDRAIRLFGSSDLERTTAAMDDAAGRLSRFLLTQTILNAGYGTVVGLALWAIGVPTPILWGVLAFLMRFVPFIGSFIAAGFPVILAAAIDPTWTSFWLTLSIYLIGEPIMGQVVEPLIQGRTTGLSPLAIVVSASFWTLLWGPIGLMLAVPLTACLVILGRHVKRLEFLHVILGDTPALEADQKFYQRALAGRADEATEDAEELLRDMSLVAYCDEVAMPGLRLAYEDAQSDILSEKRQELVRSTVAGVFDNLAAFDEETDAPSSKAPRDGASTADGDEARDNAILLDESWRASGSVCLVAARANIDGTAADVFTRLLGERGIGATCLPQPGMNATSGEIEAFRSAKLVIVSSLAEPQKRSAQLRHLIRRLRRTCPDNARIAAAFWSADVVGTERLGEVRHTIGADNIFVSCADALDFISGQARKKEDPTIGDPALAEAS